MDHFQERATWLQGSFNESKNELRVLTDEKDKLKNNLMNDESNAQEVTAQALEQANSQKKGLVDKIAELQNDAHALKAEYSSLKKNISLEYSIEEVVKARMENFKNQFDYIQNHDNL
ncbi:Uncharacterized protein Fot_37801 [Forsythia ovata]|uniref:Uncharacterized protein n=1 Tax=Forsythia ovata TaxID=205694 RepID=A0ABD1RZZ9_9LAMI